jgi:hypothetical protein
MNDITNYINGPINFFRLEYKKKIIYIFLDNNFIHTECSSTKSIDIDKYLIKIFKNTDENIDFILPYNKNKRKSYEDKKENKRDNYIKQINKLPDIINKKNINFIYKIEQTNYIYKLFNIILKYINFYTIHYYLINEIIFNMKKCKKYINKIIKNEYKNKFKFNINKELNNIKKKINELINLLKINKNNLKYGKNEKLFFDLQSKIYNLLFVTISNNILFILYIIFNLSSIDSILNNDSKTIVYEQVYHGLILIYILIKYFNFKITNKFYSDSLIDKDMNKKIKNLNMNYETMNFLGKIFIPENPIQCINFNNLQFLN